MYSPRWSIRPRPNVATRRYSIIPTRFQALFNAFPAQFSSPFDCWVSLVGASLALREANNNQKLCRHAGRLQVKNSLTHLLENRMESFFLAETTKYLYLLFDVDNFVHNPYMSHDSRNVTTRDGYTRQCFFDAGQLRCLFIPLSFVPLAIVIVTVKTGQLTEPVMAMNIRSSPRSTIPSSELLWPSFMFQAVTSSTRKLISSISHCWTAAALRI